MVALLSSLLVTLVAFTDTQHLPCRLVHDSHRRAHSAAVTRVRQRVGYVCPPPLAVLGKQDRLAAAEALDAEGDGMKRRLLHGNSPPLINTKDIMLFILVSPCSLFVSLRRDGR